MTPLIAGRRTLVPVSVLVLFVIGAAGHCTHGVDLPPAGRVSDQSSPRASDPSIARLLRELRGWLANESWRIARAQFQVDDAVAARATLEQAAGAARFALDFLDIAQVQAEMQDRDAALATLLKARNLGLAKADTRWESAQTLARIATLQLRLGDRKAARETFDQAMRFARRLEPGQKIYAFESVIKARAEAGDLAGALEDAATIDDPALRFDVLTEIDVRGPNIDAAVMEQMLRLLDAGRVPPAMAEDVDVRKEEVDGQKVDVLLRLALLQAAANDRAGAGKHLQRARQIADALQEEGPRYTYLGRVAQVLVKTGAAGEARRIADAIGETTWNRKLGVLRDIAEAHGEVGDVEGSLRAWREALQAARTGSEKFGVLMAIANVQLKAGDRGAFFATLDQALIAARSIRREDRDANPFDPNAFEVARIAKARAGAKDVRGAFQLASTITHHQIQGDALAEIASLQAESGDIAGALATTRTIRPPDPATPLISHLLDKTSALLGIIAAQATAGDVSGALTTADLLKSPDDRYVALLEIAEKLGRRRGVARPAKAAHMR